MPTNDLQKNKESVHHAEDVANKYIAMHFGQEMVNHFQIPERIKQVAPTDPVSIQVKELYEDFCYIMENGEWHHFEFESDKITVDDLRRFREYEAVTSRTYKAALVTHVLCSANVKNPLSSLTEGINTYRVKVHRYKQESADRLFARLRKKKPDEIAREDLVSVMYVPLMNGKMPIKDRIQEGLRLLNAEYEQVSKEDLKKMQAVLYVLASKFLTKQEMKEVKEEFSMNPLGQMIFDDGKAAGLAEGRATGLAEGILNVLADLGTVASDLSQTIANERDCSVLTRWLKLAAHADSIADFKAAM
ncbi:MAG: hypothetical protein IJ390_12195 [Lachnospiraceae bacterium]|nr:hypothetical protein [Lachnospiraceae bacterium]